MRRLANASLATLLMILLLTTLPARADPTLTPTDDTWANRNDPDANKDGSQLVVSYSNLPSFVVTQRAYLRFDMSALSSDVGSGTRLRLYVTAGPLFTTGTLALWSTGDDWNGTDSGNGCETTLTWNTAPAAITKLDTKAAGATGTWVEFTGSDLSDFINNQRSANGGDNIASFMVEWDGCSVCGQFDDIIFEDRENTGGTSNAPQLPTAPPTAVTLSTFRAAGASTGRLHWSVLGLLVAAAVALTLRRRRMHTGR